jgi:hypothetical protein
MFTDDFYIIIPTPFKRGDILTYTAPPFFDSAGPSKTFVLDYLDHEKFPHIIEDVKHGRSRDGSDMIGWGYYVDADGMTREDYMFSYDRFGYYRGKLEGANRLLQYISWYLKGELHLTELLQIQCSVYNDFDVSSWIMPEGHNGADGQADHLEQRENEGNVENTMTIQEIKNIAEVGVALNLDLPEDQKKFYEEVYTPVLSAIANNDMTVIAFFETCDSAIRKRLSTAIRDGIIDNDAVNEGVIRPGCERVVRLYRSIREENGWEQIL